MFHLSHTECHLSAKQQCNSTLLTFLSTSQRWQNGVNNRKKWLKRWYTSINYRHELAKGWEGWKTFALSGKKRKIELLDQGQNWHPDSYPDPPFSVWELRFLPLLQSQPAGKLLTYSSLNLTNLVCKKLVDGIHQWQPGQGSCESLLEEPDMLFESYLGEFPHLDNWWQTVCACMLKCRITGMTCLHQLLHFEWRRKKLVLSFQMPL